MRAALWLSSMQSSISVAGGLMAAAWHEAARGARAEGTAAAAAAAAGAAAAAVIVDQPSSDQTAAASAGHG